MDSRPHIDLHHVAADREAASTATYLHNRREQRIMGKQEERTERGKTRGERRGESEREAT